MRSRLRRLLPFVIGGLIVVFVAIQFVPFGQRTTNGAVRREPNWDSPRTRELAVRACFDCHSNQARYPWYSHVAPISWLVHHDVHEARLKLNFSEWDLPQREALAAVEQIEKGDMPLPDLRAAPPGGTPLRRGEGGADPRHRGHLRGGPPPPPLTDHRRAPPVLVSALLAAFDVMDGVARRIDLAAVPTLDALADLLWGRP